MSFAIPSPAAQPAVDLSDLVDRQLVVIYNATTAGFKAKLVAAAASNASVNGALHARLGAPSSGARLLEGMTSQPMQDQLEKFPDSPRARLENYVLLTYPTAPSAAAAKKRLEKDELVLSVGQNFLMSYSSVPSDRYFSINPSDPLPGSYQWGMQLMKLPQAWDKVRGNAYVGAADHGIFLDCSSTPCVTHPDLRQNFRLQFSGDVSGHGPVPSVQDISGHGTHVAGIIAATPQYGSFTNHSTNSGVAGACWTCSYVVARTDGTFNTFAAGVTYALDRGLQAVNMSWGDQLHSSRFQSCADQDYKPVCDVIEYAKSTDVVLVAAAGNSREARVAFPARSPDVIAVGGIQYDAQGPTYWYNGYGTDCGHTAPNEYLNHECGSNYGPELTVMAPAKDIVSSVIPGDTFYGAFPCGDAYGPDLGTSNGQTDGYGDCTGTSMSAPHITGIVGLIRSANPLLTRDQVKAILANSKQPCVGIYSGRCNGAGVPDAGKAVTAALGGTHVVNRLTPLFGFYSSAATDHFYTTVPQMALAALSSGMLLPQPQGGSISYSPIGSLVSGYPQFPTPPCGASFSPCLSYPEPRAIASVFVTHVNPLVGGPELVPLYRYSWACPPAPCTHASHVYSSDPAAIQYFTGLGYQLDGIEGYIHSKAESQPPGTVKLCRRYDGGRDDYILFPDTGNTNCSASSDGYTGGSYGSVSGLSDWIGWVHLATNPKAICSGGRPCGNASNMIPILMLLLD
jgi:subtilisin family serine protease